MKKLFLAAAFAVLGVSAVNAQSGYPKLGFHIGLPVGDAADGYSFNVGVDAAYLWNVAPSLDLGLASGYSHYFLKSEYKDMGYEDVGLIPIAATAKYTVAPNFFIGTDLGYGIITNEGADGGFYFQPKVGYESGKTEFYLGYKGVSNDGTLGSINLGVGFKL